MYFPNYKNSIVQTANSLRRAFGLPVLNPSLPELDAILGKKPKNVVFVVLDGLGLNIMEKHLPPESFLRSNVLTVVDSVFPPTTVASVLAYCNGLTPAQSGYLGWRMYFPELDKTIEVFTGKDLDTGELVPGGNPCYDQLPCEWLVDAINESGNGLARRIDNFDFGGGVYHSNRQMARKIRSFCRKRGRRFMFVYNNQPDTTMHREGISSPRARDLILGFDKTLERLARRLKNTVLIITADHGQVDSQGEEYISEYPELFDTLARRTDIEPRAAGVRVKPGRGEDFMRLAREHLGTVAEILSHDEAVERGIFGNAPGEDCLRLEHMLGDFLILPKPGVLVYYDRKSSKHFTGIHAGATREETEVPVIVHCG